MPISHRKGFYIYKKTNNIFLKFHHYLFVCQKSQKPVERFILKNANQKHNQHAYKQARAALKKVFLFKKGYEPCRSNFSAHVFLTVCRNQKQKPSQQNITIIDHELFLFRLFVDNGELKRFGLLWFFCFLSSVSIQTRRRGGCLESLPMIIHLHFLREFE